MTQILLKRVYEENTPEDGFRVLVDRLWPRGIKKEVLKMDLWAKEATPSSNLRTWYHQDPENRWDEFTLLYYKELEGSSAAVELAEIVKKHSVVTLLYASKAIEHNHAQILKVYLDQLLKNTK